MAFQCLVMIMSLCFATICLEYEWLKAPTAPHIKNDTAKPSNLGTDRKASSAGEIEELAVFSSQDVQPQSLGESPNKPVKVEIFVISFVVTHFNPKTLLGFSRTDERGTLI